MVALTWLRSGSSKMNWISRFFVHSGSSEHPRSVERPAAADRPNSDRKPERHEHRIRKVVRYEKVFTVTTQAEGAEKVIAGNALALVEGATAPKWLMMLCPCGCGEVRRISLSPTIRPAWRLQVAPGMRLSLYPSVWLRGECRAHFVLRDNHALVI